MPSHVIERRDQLAMKKLKVLVDWIWIGPDRWLDLSHVLGIGLLDEKPRRAHRDGSKNFVVKIDYGRMKLKEELRSCRWLIQATTSG